MIEERTFVRFLDMIEDHCSGMEQLEETLHVTFDNNFLTKTVDKGLDTLAEGFFTEEQLNDVEWAPTLETVKDIIYHYALTCEFGLHRDKLHRLYVEDEGTPEEFALDAYTPEELYCLIVRYVNPPEVVKTYTLHC